MIYFVDKLKGLKKNLPQERTAFGHGMLKWLERKKKEDMLSKENSFV
jgi:hypothetical protein